LTETAESTVHREVQTQYRPSRGYMENG